MNVSTSTLLEHIGCPMETSSGSLVKRVTPLAILPDIDQALFQYLELGFAKILSQPDHRRHTHAGFKCGTNKNIHKKFRNYLRTLFCSELITDNILGISPENS
jgi:hypothetical protein